MLQIALFVIGITGLSRRRIEISSKRVLSGTPVVLLSVFYLVVSVVTLFLRLGIISVFEVIAAVGIVTLLVVIFAKGKPPTAI